MSETGEYDSKRYGKVNIRYVSTGSSCGYWVAESPDGEFVTSADSHAELMSEIDSEGHGG